MKNGSLTIRFDIEEAYQAYMKQHQKEIEREAARLIRGGASSRLNDRPFPVEKERNIGKPALECACLLPHWLYTLTSKRTPNSSHQ